MIRLSIVKEKVDVKVGVKVIVTLHQLFELERIPKKDFISITEHYKTQLEYFLASYWLMSLSDVFISVVIGWLTGCCDVTLRAGTRLPPYRPAIQ